MNSVERTTSTSSQSSPLMWLEILGIVLGVTTVLGLAVLRAELRDRSAEQQVPRSASIEVSTTVVTRQLS
ncbi:MAG: hypothetical protein AAGA40_05875 [Cyanobacteria bacterium P01_E01_bin.45]